MIAYLFLPKAVKPPYQTVIYFPGVGVVYNESFNGLPYRDLTEYIITSGRVLAWGREHGDHEGDAVVPGAWADTAGWLQLLHGGRARDGGSCSRHSR